ncbi:aldose epimerase family protein [Parageobacillus thermoglucosidasius]|uniref:aldose epimerase family protein n=1 Tax=Parageobacillus thermoglucosidasius TaxID=1426 RepID=UPI0001D190D8|nr:aldose epimerase family protein [Parageobacillus thermoglucosidasius]AEH48195.1 Aldose 1-epimerase [Parageobacillus thermoglucosidasius C56-YS93]MBY6267631.1 galactose-1-epimerase [Parageobacillus thermoglucosidasius]OUM90094.1 MAG: galactose mutarotase [Parageobacillus thermoglucosidasius]
MEISIKTWSQLNGKDVLLFTLTNDHGVELLVTNYGCIVTKLLVPDRKGNMENVVLGFGQFEPYLENSPYFGAVIGRVAGRIQGASFELGGVTYSLAKNENNNHLHGGPNGFHRVLWQAMPVRRDDAVGVVFSYTSPDGEEGYPGTVHVQVTYWLNNDNEWTVTYRARSNKTTLLNLTNHTYFNLSGNGKRDILDHTLTIRSSRVLELNEELIPTGHVLDVANTPFDLRQGKKIREAVESEHPQIELVGGGYDHPFWLDRHHDKEIVLSDPESGRVLTVETDEVGVVVYTSNQLPDGLDLGGTPSRKYLGICLETQGLPDAIHHPQFPSIVLPAGKEWVSTTVYRFGVIE